MRILIATFDSPHSETALRLGAQLARNAGEPPTLLTVIEPQASRTLPQAEIILARAQQFFGPAASNLRCQVCIGHPAEEIIRELKKDRYDLAIVAEPDNQHGLRHRFAASVILRVVEHAPCPVLIAKGTVESIHCILLCDSGARTPSAGLNTDSRAGTTPGMSVLSRFTAQLAGLLEGEEEVTVLHVMSQISAGPGVRDRQLKANVEELIAEHTPEGELLGHDVHILEQAGVHPHAKIRHGLVLDEILEEAHHGDYDLVVVGAHPVQGWQRVLLEDLTRQIVERLDRPILVVR